MSNWTNISKTVRHDARILAGDTEGFAASGPRAMLGVSAFGMACALLLGAAIKPPAPVEDVPVVEVEPVVTALAGLDLYDFNELDGDDHNPHKTVSLTVKPGQSIGPLLQKNGVSPQTAYETTQAFATSYNPRNVRAGQKVNLYFDGQNDSFTGLSLKPNKETTVFVDKRPDGSFVSKKVTAEFKKELVSVKSSIENSLYLDAGRLGAPDKVIVQFAQIYAHSIDFQRDIRAGDEFELMFEMYRDHKGNPVKAGDLVFTSFSPRKKTANYYLYESTDGRQGYYDEKGKGAKRMLMRTPVNGARLSSRYGNRKHPVLGYRRKHKCVDFAAPTGTPIMAAGTGTVVRASRYGSYGKYVRVKHSDGYSTAYAHLSKYGRGIKSGKRVIQGQTIGYVGATGRVTGAHLHYEVLKHGKQINPMSLSALSGKPLKASEIPAFMKRAEEINAMRAEAGPAILPKPSEFVDSAPVTQLPSDAQP